MKITKEEIKQKAKKAKDVVVEKAKWTWGFSKDVMNVIRENKAVTAAVLIGIATVGSEGYVASAKGKTIAKKAEEYDCRVETDDGQHLHTSRPMNKNERKELTRRQKAGESTTEILDDMNLM